MKSKLNDAELIAEAYGKVEVQEEGDLLVVLVK